MGNKKRFNLLGIFRSQVRQKLLLIFFINPERAYYTRQLEKMFNTPASLIHRQLKALEEISIVSSRPLGNLVLYQVNQKSPFYLQFHDLILKTYGLPELFRSIFNQEKKVIVCFIYGSFAKGDFDSQSDIDIFVLVKSDNNLYERLNSKLLELEEELGREINADFFNLGEFKQRKKDEDPYLLDILENLKIFIKGGESELRFSKRQKTTSKFSSNK